MSLVLTAGRAGRGHRPAGAFAINRGSWQAHGLQYWVSCVPSGHLHDMSRSRVTIFQGGGSPIYFPYRLGGTGASFGGLSTPLQTEGFPALSLLTVAAWVRSPDGSPSWSTIIENQRGNAGDFGMWKSGNGAFWYWRWDLSGASDVGTFTSGVDTYLVGVFDGTNAIFYQDGLSVFSTASSRSAGVPGTCTVGLSGAGEPFGNAGEIVDLRVYNYAWTPMQVWEAYSPGTRWDLYGVPIDRSLWSTAATAGYLLVKN